MSSDLEGFGFHMWDEVFVNNRWVAIDPTFNQTTVDAVHIKLLDTSLEGVSPFAAFLPVVLVLGQAHDRADRDPLRSLVRLTRRLAVLLYRARRHVPRPSERPHRTGTPDGTGTRLAANPVASQRAGTIGSRFAKTPV